MIDSNPTTMPSAEPRLSDTPQPLVSVCISAYEVEGFLGQAMDSVLNQTYRNIEVILLDNGSTDRTAEVIRTIRDDRVRTFRISPNIGGYQGMNWAVEHARGDFIAVYHSDDVYEPSIVEREVAYLQSHPDVGAVFALDRYIDEDGKVFGKMTMPRQFLGRDSLTYDDVMPYLVNYKNTLFCCPTFMTRRAVWEAVGPFNPEGFGIGSDLEMWLRIVRCFPVAILNEHLMRYRVRTQNWSARDRRLRTVTECTFPVLDHYLELDGWDRKLEARDRTEYAFHRADDETERAANLVLLGDVPSARKLLRRPFPWRTFVNGVRRRKVRVVLLRAIMIAWLDLGLRKPLARLLVWSEYDGRL